MNITDTAKTLKTFFDKFAPSWQENSVPVGAALPYATFNTIAEEYAEAGIIQLRFFTEGSSIEKICELTDKLEKEIGHAGTLLNGSSGALWIYKGRPFAQVEPQPEEDIKVMYINLSYRSI